MKKFIVLYLSPISASQQMASATPEQAKAGMDAWMSWAKKAGSAVLDLGSPLGGGSSLIKGKVAAGTTQIGGYSILQADSLQAVNALLEGHPHLSQPGFSIEVLETLALPGM
jgi:hypothetical protein